MKDKEHFLPLISIIIPVFNEGDLLQATIESAVDQTYQNIEIIVVDDGSADHGRTETICKKHVGKVRYFYKEHGGRASAINFGIGKMEGDYCSLLLCDDLYYPQKIQYQVSHLSQMKDRKAIVFSNFDVLYTKTSQLFHGNFLGLFEKKFLEHKSFATVSFCMHPSGTLIHKSCFTENGLLDESLGKASEYWWLFNATRKKSPVFLREQLFVVNIHSREFIQPDKLGKKTFNKLIIEFCDALSHQEKKAVFGSVFEFYYHLYTALSAIKPQAGSSLSYLYKKMESQPVPPHIPGLPPKNGLIKNCKKFIKRFIPSKLFSYYISAKHKAHRLIGKAFHIMRTSRSIVFGYFYATPYLKEKNTEYLVSIFSIGDTLIMCGLLKEYLERNSGRAIKVFARESHKQIIEFYNYDLEQFIFVNSKKVPSMRAFFCMAERFSPKIRFCLPDKTLYRVDPNIFTNLLNLGLLPCYKNAFSLPATARFAKPGFDFSIDQKNKLLKKYKIVPGRTVVLAPYSVTLASFNYESMFEKIAKLLRKKGFTVLTNTTDNRVIPGTKPFNPDFKDTIAIAESGVWFISIRSGLCDLLFFTKCKLTVLYPTEIQDKAFSLTRMFNSRPGLHEVIISPDSRDYTKIIETHRSEGKEKDENFIIK